MKWFTERGFPISVPFQECRYDLVADYNSNLLRLQVKSGYWRELSGNKTDQFCVETRSINSSGKSEYDDSEIDAFVVMEPKSNDLYLIWIDEINGRRERMLSSWEDDRILKKLTERFK